MEDKGNFCLTPLSKKKGVNISDMYPAILTLLLIGIILGIGLYIMTQVRRTVQVDFDGFLGSANATSGTTTVNGSLTSLYINPNSVTVTWDENTTALSNYSLSEEAGIFTWGGNIVAEGQTVNITYVYSYDRDNPEQGITTAMNGLDDFADWIAIIVVVLAAAIILGLILSSFGREQPI